MASEHDSLIRGLGADLMPVRRLARPGIRALVWLGTVGVIAAAIVPFADIHAMALRIAGAPDMWLAVLGSTATAILAGIAAFQLSLPDASRNWAWLPAPGALLWVGASGLGCLRTWIVPEAHVAATDEMRDCFVFIIALSVPLSALMVLMLRRAYPLQPGLTAAIGGLAVAAAAATLLNLFHPFQVAATDLAVHAVAIALIVGVNRSLGGIIFSSAAARTM
jgi:hypothetical protein